MGIATIVTSGIPQGSVLGLLLFLIYINDLIDCCERYSDVYLFADDAKIFRRILYSDKQQRLQSGVNELVQWIQRWLLNLNVKWSPLEEMSINTVHIQCYTMYNVHL